jgi:CBS domain containing-hemolysin-like protein
VALCATFTPGVPLAWILLVLLVGGFFRSLEYTSLNTLAYADMDHERMSRATSLVAVGQQLSISIGVAIGAALVDLTLRLRGESTITAADFQPAWIVISVISAMSAFLFWSMPPDAGAEVSRRESTGPAAAADQKQG